MIIAELLPVLFSATTIKIRDCASEETLYNGYIKRVPSELLSLEVEEVYPARPAEVSIRVYRAK